MVLGLESCIALGEAVLLPGVNWEFVYVRVAQGFGKRAQLSNTRSHHRAPPEVSLSGVRVLRESDCGEWSRVGGLFPWPHQRELAVRAVRSLVCLVWFTLRCCSVVVLLRARALTSARLCFGHTVSGNYLSPPVGGCGNVEGGNQS